MKDVNAVKLATPFKSRAKHSSLFEAVKFYPYAVGVFFELLGESLEVPAQILIEKEAR